MAIQQLSADDAQFLYLETGKNLGYITSVCIYDPASAVGGKVSYDDFLRHLQGRLHFSKIFTRRLQRVPMDLDFPYWVADKDFDFHAHVSYARLPRGASWRKFCDMIGRYHSEPLDMERPPWGIKMIDGLGQLEGFPPGCYAIVTKVHHCAIDGASGVRFLLAISDADASGKPILRNLEPQSSAETKVDLFTMVSNAYGNNLSSPWRMADTLLSAVPTIFPMVRRMMWSGQPDENLNVPLTRFNQKTSPYKVFEQMTVAVADLRRIKRCVDGATVNDVALAVCSGALRRYLLHHQELPSQPLVAWTPINARPKRSRSGGDDGGNHLAAMTVNLFTGERDPLRRLTAISAFTHEAKQGKTGASVRVVTSLTKQFPGFTLALASRLVARSKLADKICNVFVSSVPGPTRPMYMNGAKCINVYGMAPLADGMGLFIATPTYNHKLSFSITSTNEILPDIQFFMDCMQKSFAELLALVEIDEHDADALRRQPAELD